MDDTNLNDEEKIFIPGGEIDKAYEEGKILTTIGEMKRLSEKLSEGKAENPVLWKKESKGLFGFVTSKLLLNKPSKIQDLVTDEFYKDFHRYGLIFFCLRALLYQRNGETIKKYRIPFTSLRLEFDEAQVIIPDNARVIIPANTDE